MDIGYNPEQINELIEQLSQGYQKVGEVISSGYPNVSNVLRENWVGEDEQSAEKTFVKRLNDLYKSSAELVNSAMNQFKELGDKWHEMQLSNKFQGGEDVPADAVDIEVKNVEVADIVTFQGIAISPNEDRGVKEGGAGAIQTSISSYVDEVKSGTDGIINGIDSSKAFLGPTQSGSIDEFLEKFNLALQSVLTAVRDIHEGVTKLAEANYNAQESEVSNAMSSVDPQSEVDSALGDMKWGS